MSSRNYFSFALLKDSTKMINPVIITLIGAIILAGAMTFWYAPPGTSLQPPQINPVPAPSNPSANPTGATAAVILNALYFVLILGIGGLLFVFFIKYGLGKLMDYLLVAVFFFSMFVFSDMILPAVLAPIFNNVDFLNNLLGTNQTEVYTNFYNLVLILSLVSAVLIAMGLLFVKNYYVHNTMMILFGMYMGAIFGVFFDSLSLFGVLIALALYDIYAVFRGPLKSMFNELDMKSEGKDKYFTDQLDETSNTENNSAETLSTKGALIAEQQTSIKVPRQVKHPQMSNGITLPVYATPYITIGLGDFAFFSVLIAKATYLALKGNFLILPATAIGTVYWGLIILPFIGILIGAYLTFVLLQKYEILPALPLPISLGVLGFALAVLLQTII